MLILREVRDSKPVRIRNVSLSGNHVSFGRSSLCTYQLEAIDALSRVQATLKKGVDGWWISDGSPDRASSNGIYIDGVKVTKPVRLEAGLSIDLFRGGDYQVVLEVSEIVEDDLPVSDQPTLEVPLGGAHEEIAALRSSVDALNGRVYAISTQLGEVVNRVNQTEADYQEVKDLVVKLQSQIPQEVIAQLGAKIDALSAEIKPQIAAAHEKNHIQDRMIAKVVVGLGVVLFISGGYGLSQERSESIRRGLDLVQILMGAGGLTLGMNKSSQKQQDGKIWRPQN
jgi:hypothetical protein